MRIMVPEKSQLDGIENRFVKLLKDRKMHVATAESVTGGLVSKLITDVSGASTIFECGVCSYSNRIKNRVLNVGLRTLDMYTEYSEECAIEMALGVRMLSGANIGISTTGIAGTGGTKEKPAGTVYIGISTEHDYYAYEIRIGADTGRNEIRRISAKCALYFAYEILKRY